MTYAGDKTPKEAWALLEEDPSAVLVDVRTEAEFAWVGNPDLSSLGRDVLRVEWITFPDMDPNPDFVAQVNSAVPGKDTLLVFICRSGVRSADAAAAMTAVGYTRCFNLAGGFEGDRDEMNHRGTVNGWKVDGLPWSQ